MATLQRICTAMGILALGGAMNAPEVWAQVDDPGSVRVRKIDTQELNKPSLRENNPNAGSQDWVRITAEFDTSREWMDELEVSMYALFEPDARRADMRTPVQYLLLRGQTRYMNVKRGSHYSEMYVHPNTIERYGNIERIAVVFKAQGRTLAAESDPKSKDFWWQQLSPVDGLILKAAQTPYNPVSPDHHESTQAISTTGR